jgi:small subunit ribosomal protein S6
MEMKKYELMVIINSRITQKEIDTRVKELKELLRDISFEEIWGVRPFAYSIKGHEQGYYAVWNFSMDPSDIKDMEKTLQLFPDLIRYLIVQVPDQYKSITLQEIDAGLDELRKQKAEKRGSVRNAQDKRKDDEKKVSSEVRRAPDAPAPAPAPTPAPAPAPVAAAKVEKTEASEGKKAEKGKKSFDEKLDDILSDDDLGL